MSSFYYVYLMMKLMTPLLKGIYIFVWINSIYFSFDLAFNLFKVRLSKIGLHWKQRNWKCKLRWSDLSFRCHINNIFAYANCYWNLLNNFSEKKSMILFQFDAICRRWDVNSVVMVAKIVFLKLHNIEICL